MYKVGPYQLQMSLDHGVLDVFVEIPSLATNAQVIIRITVDVVVGPKPVEFCWVGHSQEVEYPRWDEHVLVNKHIVEIQIK